MVKGTVEGLRTLIRAGALGSLEDGELLDRFVATGEPAAFEVIVRRHGPMVWGVCRRALRDHHDAEDAFQATFLVLARRADAVRPRDRLVAWLYGVARRTALKARTARARRRLREGRGKDPEPTATTAEPREFLAESLDRELARLPEKYRLPIVLCDLEGRTHREAAERLGCPIGTLSGRHSRARALLADRLRRRGLAPSAGIWPALKAERASATVPTTLALACSGRMTTVPSTVVALARKVQGGLLMTKIKTSAAVLAMAVAAGMGAIGLAADRPGPSTPPAPARKPTPPAKAEDGLATHAYYVGDIIGANPQRPPTAAELQPVIALVASTIAPETWGDGDGSGPFIAPHPVAASLLVRHDRATLDRVGALLHHVRLVHDARLDAPSVPSIPAEEGAEEPRAGAAPPASALTLGHIVLAGRPHPRAAEGRPAPALVNRMYPIGDLIGVDPGPPEDPAAIPDDAWSLAARITEEVAPESWIPKGGTGWLQPHHARVFHPSAADRPEDADPARWFLVLGVRQTVSVQDKVGRFLETLRRARASRPAAP